MPGWNRYSIGYHSADGFKSHNYPFTAQSYGPALKEGDVLGVGYRPRTGAVFFTRNGKKLEDAYIGLTKHNLFPTVAADGSCTVHVNLGQAGFVFIEANVKKWGLAPMIGTLAPPPAYGSERGSILLESANGAPQSSQSLAPQHHHRQRSDDAAAVAALQTPENNDGSSSSSSRRHTPHSHHHSTSSHRRVPSGSTVPIRPSPLRASMTRPRVASYDGSSASSPVSIPGTLDERDEFRNSDEDDDDMPHNPPTPGQLDISLRSMSPFSRRQFEEEEEEHQRLLRSNSLTRNPSQLLAPRPQPVFSPPIGAGSRTGDVSPPSYRLLDVNQYPAGVAEAMLEAMPEDQFQALFTAAANANTTRGSTASSPAGRAYEGHTSNESGSGLRGLFGGIFRQSSTEQTDQLPR
ncbi:Protein ssh4 [Cystobasidiomycetes sp. EMM_F5]